MKTGIITGASRGIGRAIAVRMAGDSFKLFLLGRDREALMETARMVAANGGTAEIVTGDLSLPEDVELLARSVGDGEIDLLVNNAGVAYVKPFEQITLDEWHRTLAVNVTAPFLITQKLLNRFSQSASIVNILSIAARTAFPNWSSYSMSKAALDGLMKSVREELRPRGIRVINVYPSATQTDIWENVPGDWPKDKMLRPEEIAEAVHYAVNRPSDAVLEEIVLGNIGGVL